jgi:hypothetical protein
VGNLGVKYTTAAVFDTPFENLERPSLVSAGPLARRIG